MHGYRMGRASVVALVLMAVVTTGWPVPARAAIAPGAPIGLTAAAGDDVVQLTWIAPDDGGSPILGYLASYYTQGVLYYQTTFAASPTTLTLDPSSYVLNTLEVTFQLSAWNDAGYGAWAESNTVTPTEGASAPQSVVAAVSTDGGTLATDPAGVDPGPTNPVITSVTVPETLGGGTLSIAETSISEAPSGYTFLGQDIVIHSTAETSAVNPLSITFRVDPAAVPATIFRNGVPITTACDPGGTATPESPCIASGAGTDEITVLSAAASVWNVGIADYAFGGFSSPVDSAPVTNLVNAGRAIPVRFALGGDQGLNIFGASPRSREIDCSESAPVDGVEETASTPSALSFSQGTGLYQFAWGTQRSWKGSCRELVMSFRDGTEVVARFAFR